MPRAYPRGLHTRGRSRCQRGLPPPHRGDRGLGPGREGEGARARATHEVVRGSLRRRWRVVPALGRERRRVGERGGLRSASRRGRISKRSERLPRATLGRRSRSRTARHADPSLLRRKTPDEDFRELFHIPCGRCVDRARPRGRPYVLSSPRAIRIFPERTSSTMSNGPRSETNWSSFSLSP